MKRRVNRVLALLCVLALAVSMVSGLAGLAPMKAQAGTGAIEAPGAKATASDVKQPTAENKKGIQGTEFLSDANYQQLGVNHVLMNLELNKMLKTSGTGNPYVYNGTTYYFDWDGYIKPFEWTIKDLRQKNIAVTVVLLMGWSDDAAVQNLIFPGGREKSGHYYYALNSTDASAQKTLSAMFHFLTERFGQKECFVQNWIVGNEINMPDEYNYCGTADLNTNISIAANSFKLMYDAVKDNSPYSKVYISLDDHFNTNEGGLGISVKDFLSNFDMWVGNMGQEYKDNWNIAFHAYAPDMQKQPWTKEYAQWLRNDFSSKYVCGANIQVLTEYVKTQIPNGYKHRIILSEQGYDNAAGEAEAAANLIYTYKAAARNDMIDATMFVGWRDATASDTIQLKFKPGLLDAAGAKRPLYYAFRDMEKEGVADIDKYLKTIGIKAWTDNMIYSAEAEVLEKGPDTSCTITSASLFNNTDSNDKKNGRVRIGATVKTSKEFDIDYRWTATDSAGNSYVISDWMTNYEWVTWYPTKADKYDLKVELKVLSNPDASKVLTTQIYYGVEPSGKVSSLEAGTVSFVSGDTVKLGAKAEVTESAAEYKWSWVEGNSFGDINLHWSTNDNVLEWKIPDPNKTYAVICDARIIGVEETRQRITFFVNAKDKTSKFDGGKDAIFKDGSDDNNSGSDPAGGDDDGEFIDADPDVAHKYIKGQCQLPYEMVAPGEPGYLIGFQTRETNPNYRYEMMIYDCTAQAWVYRTGACQVPEDCFWTVWQPEYGYFWTLFVLTDVRTGKEIDRVCYGFQNICY